MERTVTVVPEAGLHARPASKLVQTANRFDAEVSIGRAGSSGGVETDERNGAGVSSEEHAAAGAGELVPANSMLSVTGLNVAHGESVRVVAEGPDAADALDAVCALLTTPVEDGEGGDDE